MLGYFYVTNNVWLVSKKFN